MASLYHRFTTAALHLVKPYSSTDVPPSPHAWQYLRSHLTPLKNVLILSLVFTVIAASIEVWMISFAGDLIDTLNATDPAELWSQHKVSLIFAAVTLLLLRPLSQLFRQAVNDIGVNCNAATLFRWRAHNHLSKQSVGWFQEDLTGRTAIRLVEVGNQSSDVIYRLINTLAYGLVYMVGIVVLMSGTDVRLAIPLLLWLVLYIGMMFLYIPRMVEAQQKFQSAKSALTGVVVDGFSNIDTMKLFSDRGLMVNDHRAGLEKTRLALFRTRQIGVSLRAILSILEGIVMVGFVGYGIWLWTSGAATIGLIGAAVALTLRITTMAEWIFESIWWTFLRVGSVREALKTIAQPLAIPITPDAPELVVSSGKIEISSLTHHYGMAPGGMTPDAMTSGGKSGRGKSAGGLNHVSLTINAGEKIAIVGRSGAGKSTLVNLILRFHEAEHGSISIDGQNIQDVEQDSLRAAIGMVSQQAALLNRSVRENIALGREDISHQQIEHAAREARAHEFIENLVDSKGRRGYDAHVGERGIKLSGGQRQRIALSRVILKGAPILILDEATSALDSEVEAQIQLALKEVMSNKTVIAIAHRLSTIANMDRIIVMDEGAVVEEGTHQELLNGDTLYAKFWRRQSGGFIGISAT